MTDPSEQDDARLVAAYRALPRPVPSAALDAAVLAHARAAARPARSRWIGGVATAAVLMLAVGIGWQLRHEPLADGPIAPTVPAAESTPMAVDADRSARAQAPLKKETDAGAGADASALERQRDAPPPAPAAKADERERRESKTVASGPLASSTASTDALESLAVPPPPAPPAAAAPPVAVAPPEASAMEEVAEPKRANQAPLADSALPATQAASAGRADTAAEPAPAPGAGEPEGFIGQSAPRAAPDARSPLDWLNEIRRLRDQGNPGRAADELVAFRSVYPDLPIPDDLKSLLR